jgi:hypothetical protein
VSADALDSHDAHAGPEPFSRPDPRRRPPDPAGTQPKVDPESLHTYGFDARAAPPVGGASTAPTTIGDPGADPSGGAPPPSAAPISPVEAAATPVAVVEAAATPVAVRASHAAPVESVAKRTPNEGARRARRSNASRNSHRFQFLFGALGAFAVAAIALAVALLRAPAPAAETPWSAWKPASGEVDPAQQIAAHVAPRYRLEDGKQLVRVTGGPPVLDGKPLTVGIFRSGQTPAELEGNNVLFQLCGGGTDCSIKAGKPSEARGLLVEREALELALYTFHYVSGVEHVIVTMPPPPPGYEQNGHRTGSTSASGANASGSGTAATGGLGASAPVVHHAFLLTPQDLASALEQPLSATLSAVTPRISQIASWPDASTVKTLIAPYVHDYTVSETQQAGPVMLLEPPGIGG